MVRFFYRGSLCLVWKLPRLKYLTLIEGLLDFGSLLMAGLPLLWLSPLFFRLSLSLSTGISYSLSESYLLTGAYLLLALTIVVVNHPAEVNASGKNTNDPLPSSVTIYVEDIRRCLKIQEETGGGLIYHPWPKVSNP